MDQIAPTPKKLSQLNKKFSSYIEQLPVVRFNSGFYDLNLLRMFFFKSLTRHCELSTLNLIKKNIRVPLLA